MQKGTPKEFYNADFYTWLLKAPILIQGRRNAYARSTHKYKPVGTSDEHSLQNLAL